MNKNILERSEETIIDFDAEYIFPLKVKWRRINQNHPNVMNVGKILFVVLMIAVVVKTLVLWLQNARRYAVNW